MSVVRVFDHIARIGGYVRPGGIRWQPHFLRPKSVESRPDIYRHCYNKLKMRLLWRKTVYGDVTVSL